MKILMFIHSLLGGGAERVTTNLANQWAEQGNDVTIVTVNRIDTDFYKVSPSVKRIGLDLDVSEQSVGVIRSLDNRLARVRALRRLLKSQRPDIALSMMVEANLTLALAGMGLRSIVKIGSERIHPPQTPLGAIREFLRQNLYKHLNAIVALTEESAEWLRQHTDARKVTVIPNTAVWPLPQQESRIAPPTDKPPYRLLAVGRLEQQKGFDLLISAFGTLASKFPNWNLIILGEGPQRSHLESQLGTAGLSNRVALPGRVGNLADWYKACDLFVMSSRYEGFPNTLVEAMAHGLPAVSFDCPTGPSDIIEHGVNGLLVKPENAHALTLALENLMSDETHRTQLAAKATGVRDLLHPDAIGHKWQTLFRELTEKHH